MRGARWALLTGQYLVPSPDSNERNMHTLIVRLLVAPLEVLPP